MTRTTPRRIAVISEHASPLAPVGSVDSGGQNVYVGTVSRQLAARGHSVDIFTRRDNLEQPEVVPWEKGVRVIHVPAGPPRFVRKEELLPYMDEFTGFVQRFTRWQKRPYDLVHAHFWMSGLVACELKRTLGLPFVITFHALGKVRRAYQGDADEFSDRRFQIEERIVREADQLIAECPQDEEDLISLYQAEPGRLTIIPCGYDPAEFLPVSRPFARAMLDLDPALPTLLQLGRLVPRKGIDTAIQGFARLVRRHDCKAQLLIVGGNSEQPDPVTTPEIARLTALAREEGVGDLVRFLGSRPRKVLRYFYSAADIFITTPWYEPFGITPLEAMACGTPVVGSAVGGIKYTVQDGITGYLVPPRDPDALAERLARLYRNPELLRSFGEQAILRARDFFTWSRVVDDLDALYERLTRPAVAPVLAATGTDSPTAEPVGAEPPLAPLSEILQAPKILPIRTRTGSWLLRVQLAPLKANTRTPQGG